MRAITFLYACAALLLLCGSPAAGAEPPCPIIERATGGFLVRMPGGFRRALDLAVPGFKPWSIADYDEDIQHGYKFTMRQAPWAVVGDFNGDGWCDLVVDGRDKVRSCRLVVWGGHEPRAEMLDHTAWSDRGKLQSVLQYYGPGHIEFSDDSDHAQTMELFTDAFNDYSWERAGMPFFWKVDHFEEFTTSD